MPIKRKSWDTIINNRTVVVDIGVDERKSFDTIQYEIDKLFIHHRCDSVKANLLALLTQEVCQVRDKILTPKGEVVI